MSRISLFQMYVFPGHKPASSTWKLLFKNVGSLRLLHETKLPDRLQRTIPQGEMQVSGYVYGRQR